MIKLKQNGDETMRKLKTLKYSLVAAAVGATALCVSSPLQSARNVSGLVYCLFVLSPLLAATILQLGTVRRNVAQLIFISNCAYSDHKSAKKHLRFSPVINDDGCTFAYLKSEGINPNRAGPAMIFA